MRDVIVPFEAGAGCARDREHDELIDRARQRTFELQEEAQLLDAAGELGMVEQREIGAADAFAVRLAARRHRVVERPRLGGQRCGVHVQHGHGAFFRMRELRRYSWYDHARAPALKSYTGVGQSLSALTSMSAVVPAENACCRVSSSSAGARTVKPCAPSARPNAAQSSSGMLVSALGRAPYCRARSQTLPSAPLLSTK